METDDPPLVDGGWASKLVAATLQVGCCLLYTALSRCSRGARPARYGGQLSGCNWAVL